MKKTMRNIITAVLVAALSLSLFSAVAFADNVPESEKETVVVFGDYTARKLADALEDANYDVERVIEEDMRPIDLYAAIEPNFTDYDKLTDEFLGRTRWNNYFEGTSLIKNSDYVVLDLGMDNFSSYLVKRLLAVADYYRDGKGYGDHQFAAKYADYLPQLGVNKYGINNNKLLSGTFDSVLKYADEDMAALIGSVRGTLLRLFGLTDLVLKEDDFAVENASPAVVALDSVLYAAASYIIFYEKLFDEIYTINRDANVIVYGLYNPCIDLNLDIAYDKVSEEHPEEHTHYTHIDLDAVFEFLVSALNGYLTNGSKYSGKYKFADMSAATLKNDTVQTLVNKLQGFVPDEKDKDAEELDKTELAKLSGKDFKHLNDAYIELNKLLWSEHDACPINPWAYWCAIWKIANFNDATYPKAENGQTPSVLTLKIDENFHFSAREAAEAVSRIAYDQKLNNGDEVLAYIWLNYLADGVGCLGIRPLDGDEQLEAFEFAKNSKFAANGTVLNIVVAHISSMFDERFSGTVSTVFNSLIQRILDSQASFAARVAAFFNDFNNIFDWVVDLFTPTKA